MQRAGVVVVTAASGHVGREVVRVLSAKGHSVRAAGPSLSALRAAHGDGVEAARLDFCDQSTFQEALAGSSGLFLVRPPAIAEVKSTLLPFIDAAVNSGVQHVVFLSVIGAGENPLVPHYQVEQHLRSKVEGYTFLRPGFFSQNLGSAYRDDIASDGKLFVPVAHGRIAFVDIRDVAEVAAVVFADPAAHRGKAYTLTGPEAVSFEEVAELLSEVLGRRIKYEPASVVSFVRHLHDRGLPLSQVAVQTVLHVGLRYGQAEHVDPTLEQLLGRRGHTVERYVRDHHNLWRP